MNKKVLLLILIMLVLPLGGVFYPKASIFLEGISGILFFTLIAVFIMWLFRATSPQKISMHSESDKDIGDMPRTIKQFNYGPRGALIGTILLFVLALVYGGVTGEHTGTVFALVFLMPVALIIGYLLGRLIEIEEKSANKQI